MRILKENVLVLAIDIQEKLFPYIYENEVLLSNTRKFIEGIQAMELPIIVSEQYRKGLGATLPEIAELFPSFQPYEKIAFSCCDDEKILNILKETDRKTVILFGIETHICVLQTAIDLIAHGFQPVIIADCCSSRKLAEKEFALKRLRREGAIVTTWESMLFELCRYAGTEQFKVISKLVR